MAIYAISDLHLSLAQPKPMDIFGDVWKDYLDKLKDNWDRLVTPSDVVLIPGDISWASRLSDARPDLDFIIERPGRKILVRGNHDYWWQRRATARIQNTVDKNLIFLQGTSVVIDGVGITGTRGWRVDWEQKLPQPFHELPFGDQDDPNPEKIYKRELKYFEQGLCSIPDDVKLKIAMLHYPPFDERLEPNEFAHLLSKYSVDILVYGHVHLGLGSWVDGVVEGVEYRLVSADIVNFVPQLIVA